MRKELGFAFFTLALLTSSCQQPNSDQTLSNPTTIMANVPQAEITALKEFIDASNTVATADDRGFYYTIHSPGSGEKPTVRSNVTVNYNGQLTNGNTFDSGKDISFGLYQLITGWQEGIPLIAPGGSITLYLPPSLAYGSRAQRGIPANSILIFKIDLIRINS